MLETDGTFSIVTRSGGEPTNLRPTTIYSAADENTGFGASARLADAR